MLQWEDRVMDREVFMLAIFLFILLYNLYLIMDEFTSRIVNAIKGWRYAASNDV
jgi:hypothetical protein